MSKNTMIVWAILIVTILACILVIGFKYKKQYPYIKYKNNLKLQTKKYIEKESSITPNENISISVTTGALLKKRYIKTTKVNNKDCNGKIVVSYDNEKYNYDVKIKCK